MIYYMGLVGRLWQIYYTYLNNKRKAKEKEKRYKKRKEKQLRLSLLKRLTIIKAKGCGVVHQEVNEAVDDDITWSCRGIAEVTLHNNMFMCLYLSLATGIAKGRVRKEALLVLTNGGIICGHMGKTGTQ